MEQNYILTIEDMAEMTNEDFKEMNVPIGIVKRIKKELAARSSDPTAFIQNAKILSRTRTLQKVQAKSKLFLPNERVFILVGNRDYSFRRS